MSDAPTGWDADEQMPLPDEPMAVDDWGTTEREELVGEPLAVRRQREVPDAIGDLDPFVDDSMSAEEAAVRIDEDPPGITGDDSPGYLEE
ncbi:MAG: hypothetical protein ACRD12_18950 [Acidimicrobiales bacterium]